MKNGLFGMFITGKTEGAKLARLLFVSLLYLSFLFPPLPPGLSEEARRALVVFGYSATLWIFNIINPSLVAMLSMISLPALGIISYSEALVGFSNTTVWLLVGVFLISAAIQKSNLDKRIALSILRIAGGNARFTLFGIVLMTLILVIILPTSIGRAAVVTPICLGLVRALKLKPGSNFGKGIFLAFSFTSVIASIAVITGAIVTIYAADIFSQLFNVHWSYLRWMQVMLPVALCSSLIVWLSIIVVFPPEFKTVPGGIAYIRDSINELGRFKADEVKMMLYLVALITLWVTEPLTGLSLSYSCLIIALLLALPKIGVIEWKSAIASISWNTVLMLGSILSIALAITNTGAIVWVADFVFSKIAVSNYHIYVFALAIFTILMRLGFPNNFTIVAIILPVAFSIANTLGINPTWLGMLIVCMSTLGVFLPSQAVTHLTTYSSGYYQIADMRKSGLVVGIGCFTLYFVFAYVYWPLVGLSPLL